MAAVLLMSSQLWADNTVTIPDVDIEEEEDDSTTTVPAVTPAPVVRQGIYDLQGRRVTHPQSGHIYIVNGRLKKIE